MASPSAATLEAFVSGGVATLNGQVVPAGAENLSFYFQYGPTTAYGSQTPAQLVDWEAVVLGDSPVSLWRLNESSGTAAHDVQGANPGTYTGGVTLGQAGPLAYGGDTAVLLDGSTGSVGVPYSATLDPSTWSLEAWCNLSTAPPNDAYGAAGVVARRLWQLDVSTDRRLVLSSGPYAGVVKSSSGAVPLHAWVHVVGTYDGTNLRIYLNGALVGGPVAASWPPSGSGALSLGFDPAVSSGSDSFFPGDLADAAVYNYALSPTQVANHYSAGTSAPASPDSVSAEIAGLSPGVYHYRTVFVTSAGTFYGQDEIFQVLAPTPSAPGTQQEPHGLPLTYVLYDLATGKYLGRLPLTGVTFGSQLLTPGTFSGTLDVASQAVQNLAPLSITQTGRTMLCVDYLGALVWGGIVNTRNRKWGPGTARQLQVTATELWSYFSQRMQATDYSAPPYSGLTGNSAKMAIWDASNTDSIGVYDPVLIAWQLLSDGLTQVRYGNVVGGMGIAANGFTTPASYLASGTQTALGDYLSVNYPYASLQQLASIISMLASNGLFVGFDYAVDFAYSSGPGSVPVATANLSYPRRGRTYATNNLVLHCGSAISYEIPEDATQAGNTFYEQGMSGSLSVSQNILPLQGGYPILEQIASRANITSANVLAVLQAMGVADLAIRSYPVATPTVTMDLFRSSVPLGDFVVGDDARWVIPAKDGAGQTFDPLMPNGLDAEWRISGYQVNYPDAGQPTITFTLILPPATSIGAPYP